jgi:hypothetical protein
VQGLTATGVAVLVDSQQQQLCVASVGTAHALLAEVVGSFSQVRRCTAPR